jgi:hypothetical protein
LEKGVKDPQIILDWSLIIIFLEFIWICLAKLIFIQKQNSQNRSKGMFGKQPFRPKTLSQKY